MIQQDKLKTMTQLALYEKKRGKQDLSVYTYERKDFICFEQIKTVIASTAAYILILGMIVIWNIDELLSRLSTMNYGKTGIILLAGYLLFVGFYTQITRKHSRELYNQVRPRIRQYYRNLRKLEVFYENEERMRKEFEKGEWRDGK